MKNLENIKVGRFRLETFLVEESKKTITMYINNSVFVFSKQGQASSKYLYENFFDGITVKNVDYYCPTDTFDNPTRFNIRYIKEGGFVEFIRS